MLFHCVRITTVINVFPKNVSLLKTIWFGADRQYHRSKLDHSANPRRNDFLKHKILGRTFFLVNNLLFLESYMSLNASVPTASTIFRLSWQSPTSPLPRLPTIWASTALGSLDTLSIYPPQRQNLLPTLEL